MAVVNTKSTIVTNADATPVTLTNDHIGKARVLEEAALVSVAAADDDTSVYRAFRVKSSSRVSRLLLWNSAITAGTSYDLGLYRTAKDGGAVVDADFWASAVDMSTARAVPLDATYEAGAAGGLITNVEKRIWEILGLTVDPFLDYDVCFTANTVGTAAGSIACLMVFVP